MRVRVKVKVRGEGEGGGQATHSPLKKRVSRPVSGIESEPSSEKSASGASTTSESTRT